MTDNMSQKAKHSNATLVGVALFVAVAVAFVALWTVQRTNDSQISAISRDGVVTEIQKMARLTTVSFGVDTVITAQKEGTWQKLWQDEQKGLFIAKGRVLAGVDLSQVVADDVVVHYPKGVDEPINITINLPKSQIFEVFLDDIQVYDWQTGLFGVVDNDPEILRQAQTSAKTEILQKACQGEIVVLARDNAKEQIKHLFALTGASVTVKAEVGECVWGG